MDGNIFIDYRDTLKKADELEELATQIESRIVGYMTQSESVRRGNWTGSTAELCDRKNRQIVDKLSGHARDLKNTAAGLRDAANFYKTLEEKASAIFG